MVSRMRCVWFIGVLALVTVGCGQKGPKLVPVEGTLKVNGEPIEGALIEFQPDDVSGSPSYGDTDAHGFYEMKFSPQRSGALVGTHTFRITTENENLRKPEILPPMYHIQSQEKREVKDEKNVIDFDIQLAR